MPEEKWQFEQDGLIISASRSRYGSRALPIRTTRPSAGDSTAFGWVGTWRGGSRKNCSTNTNAIHATNASTHHDRSDSTTAMTSASNRKGHPSRAMTGCG